MEKYRRLALLWIDMFDDNKTSTQIASIKELIITEE
jgi:hypothetical protein